MNNSSYISPTNVSYYYAKILRTEANKILENHKLKDGSFLLRDLIDDCGSYVLSICYKKEISNFKIIRQEDGTVKIGNRGKSFSGPNELIKYHQKKSDGLKIKPMKSCDRPKGAQPVCYLIINDVDFYKLVSEEINEQLSQLKPDLTAQEFNRTLAEASGKFRYKYEKKVLKKYHLSQPWFKKDMNREAVEDLFRKFGLIDGKFVVRSVSNNENEEYKLAPVYQIYDLNKESNIKLIEKEN